MEELLKCFANMITCPDVVSTPVLEGSRTVPLEQFGMERTDHSDTAERLHALAKSLGIDQIPESWPERWHAFEAAGPCPEAAFEIPERAVELLDLPEEAVDVLARACETTAKNGDLTRFAQFWHHMICHMPARPVDCRQWPNPVQPMGELAAMFPLVAWLSTLGHGLARFAELETPEDVVRDTLSDVGLWAGNYYRANGKWGLGELIWLVRHVRGEIFRLGRLQFALNTYIWPWRVYRNRNTRELIVLCEGGVTYGSDGLVLEPGENPGSEGTWISEFDENSETVTGSPVRPADGVAGRERVTLNLSEWEQTAVPGDDSLEVHIPAGSKMDHDACTESFRHARDFFPPRFPERAFKLFTCYSWLCDPALALIMPPETNLSRFQRRFYVLPREGKQKQTADRVFGSDSIDPAKAPRRTSLQRAIADYVSSGGVMRCAAGIIPFNE